MRLHWPLAALIAFNLACDSDDAVTDAAVTDADPTVDAPAVNDLPAVTDTGVDVPRDAGVPLFGPCTTVTNCRGIPSAQCITVGEGYPQGQCTRSCTNDTQCGAGAMCLDFGTRRVCFKRCEAVTDCRAGYNCFVARGAGDEAERACFPFCTDDAQCPGSACNRYTRFCGVCDAARRDAGGCTTLDQDRADNGGTCVENFDCRSGRCFEEFNVTSGEASGYLGGLCYSRCTVPEASEYARPTYPRGDCPEGSVCAREPGQVAGQTALCRRSCTSNTDCRGGYICLKASRGADAGTYDNGYCAPMNCHYMTQTCPSDATCLTTRSDDAGVPTSGRCVRPPPSDAAVTDASADASADAPSADAPSASDAGLTDAPADGG